MDEALSALYDFTVVHIFRTHNPTEAERMRMLGPGDTIGHARGRAGTGRRCCAGATGLGCRRQDSRGGVRACFVRLLRVGLNGTDQQPSCCAR